MSYKWETHKINNGFMRKSQATDLPVVIPHAADIQESYKNIKNLRRSGMTPEQKTLLNNIKYDLKFLMSYP